MSAVFGIIDLRGKPLDDSWVASVQSDLGHRGPDGRGLYRESSVALGHMLLQVTPESVYEKSPYDDGDFVITADARLDEREVLMDGLGVMPEERDTITDPLLLLKAFRKYGRGFVKDIYGDFALAIWDKRKRELFCARDHMGIKPFIYYYREGKLVFSTELRAIVNLPFITTGREYGYLRDHALGISTSSSATGWKNIYRLMPATTLVAGLSGTATKRYWSPSYKRNRYLRSAADSAAALRETLLKVIKDHTRVMGDVGVPLSGGLDSGTIACLTGMLLNDTPKKVVTVSSVYDPEEYDHENPDEREYINEVIKRHDNIDPLFVKHTEVSFSDGMAEQMDRLYAPVNGQWYVDEALHRRFQTKKVRRVLSGYMGDMTVSNSQLNPFLALFFQCRIGALRKLINEAAGVSGRSRSVIFRSRVIYELMPANLKKLISNKSLKTICDNWCLDDTPLVLTYWQRRRLQKRVYRYYRPRLHDAFRVADSLWKVTEDNLGEEWDCISSHHMTEMTFPLADRRVVELLLTIPVEHFYAGGMRRGLVRMAMEGILPEKVRAREDKGFYSPGYCRIIQRDVSKILKMTDIIGVEDELKEYIDWEKLKKTIEKQGKFNIMNSFVFLNWIIIDMIIWVYFEAHRNLRSYTI